MNKIYYQSFLPKNLGKKINEINRTVEPQTKTKNKRKTRWVYMIISLNYLFFEGGGASGHNFVKEPEAGLRVSLSDSLPEM